MSSTIALDGIKPARSLNKRLILIIIVTLAVGFTFWLGSRVPNLNEKAMMGGDAQIEALGFDQVYAIHETDSFVAKVLKTTVNWMDTNKRGMTFGVLFAACLMTLFSLFRRRSVNNGFGNALLGVLIGTPLGVCVNCAAPIAKGLHSAGTRLETTLAAMISSPTMNVIVLGMLFALMPWYLVMTKIALTLFLILVFIPIMCRMLFTNEQLALMASRMPEETGVCELPIGDSPDLIINKWKESVLWLVTSLPKNLWHIMKTTVPLMALAGLLGALMIVAIPWDLMVDVVPTIPEGAIFVLGALAVLAVIGTFLPVPITFDVVIVAVLLATGLPDKYSGVLLFTLGVFSIYSFQIIWKYISKPIAMMLYAAVCALGVCAGVAAHYLGIWDGQQQREIMYEQLSLARPAPTVSMEVPAGTAASEILQRLERDKLEIKPLPVQVDDAGIQVLASDSASRATSAPITALFTALPGAAYGINEQTPFSLLKHLPPRYWGRSIATGDVHGDGRPDILISRDIPLVKGFSLYANIGGEGFEKQAIDLELFDDMEVVNVALVDVDNDAWLDMFIGTYRSGNYIVYNNHGSFDDAQVVRLPEAQKHVVTAAASFADVDEDGDIDILLGNWSLGYFRNIVPGEPATAIDYLLIQDNGEFSVRKLNDYPGETLSALLTDMNNDNNIDLVVGNDYARSDFYYLGDGAGGFSEILSSGNKILHTTNSTMSIANADINNDLIPELYVAQITVGEGAGFARNMIRSTEICDDLAGQERRDCRLDMRLNEGVDVSHAKNDIRICRSIDSPQAREDCVVLHVLWTAQNTRDPSYCEMIPAHRDDINAICTDMFAEHIEIPDHVRSEAIPQFDANNILLSLNEDGTYSEMAKDLGINVTGWSWNAKFADLDNDTWQDLYVANGRFPSQRRESNFFFRNRQGTGFENFTENAGLTESRATGAYSYVDIEGDGDLDIISVPVHGDLKIFRNNSSQLNSISVSVLDGNGNSHGIGSKVFVTSNHGKTTQMREIQSGGGFRSFDPPVAHFGLGEQTEISQLEVLWSTGETTVVNGPLRSGRHYYIMRDIVDADRLSIVFNEAAAADRK